MPWIYIALWSESFSHDNIANKFNKKDYILVLKYLFTYKNEAFLWTFHNFMLKQYRLKM